MPASSPPQAPYPVELQLTPTHQFDRIQVALRLVVCMALGLLHLPGGGPLGFLFLLLPVTAAVVISQKGGARYCAEDAGWLLPALSWVVAFYAYLMFVTDRFPLDPQTRHIHVRAIPQGCPSVADALLRLLKSIPHFVLLALLGFVAAIISVVAAVWVLFERRYPDSWYAFQRDVLAWTARVLTYHAALVSAYPPFSLHTHSPTSQPGAQEWLPGSR